MNNHSIIRIIRETALLTGHKYDQNTLRFVEINTRDYNVEDFNEFRNDLFDAGSKIRLLFLEQYVPESDLENFVKTSKTKVVAFKYANDDLHPCLLSFENGKFTQVSLDDEDTSNAKYFLDQSENIVTLIPYPYSSLVSEYSYEGDSTPEALNPVQRFWRLLLTERKDILYIAKLCN